MYTKQKKTLSKTSHVNKCLKKNAIQIGLSLAIWIIVVLPVSLAGCPGPRPSETPPPRQYNYLEIPPLGTEFIYEGEDVNWNWQPHPRVMARPGILESFGETSENEILENLDELASSAIAQMTADPEYHEAVAPLALAYGYKITGDRQYLESVRNSMSWLLDFPKLVKYPEGDNIAFLQQAMSLAGVYDLLYDDLSDEERVEIEGVLRDTVFHTLAYKVTEYDADINFWANDPDTNYYLIFHSTAGLIAIILRDIEPDAESLAEHCFTRVRESMDAFADQNGWVEGLTYLDFCWGQSALYFLLALERNSDEKPFEEPWFEASIRWASWGALPDRETIACFGDNEPENYSVGSYLARLYALTGEEWFHEEALATGQAGEIALDLPIFEVMCLDREKTSIPESILPDFSADVVTDYLPGLEWGFIRTGMASGDSYPEDDFYIAFKSGVSGYDHNHMDQGSMILAAYSEILLSDPGRGGPDIIRHDPYVNCLFEAGLGHNTLIFDDGCFMDLGLFPDNSKYFSDKGRITYAYQDEQTIQYTTDNSGLYPTEPLSQFLRTFIYIKPGIITGYESGALIIADHVELESEKSHSFLFHTPGEVVISETGIAELINNGARLNYFGWSSVPSADKAERQDTSMPSRDSTCYYRSTENPEIRSDWVHVLVPSRESDPEPERPTFTSEEESVVIEWESYQVLLNFISDTGWVLTASRGN